MLETATIEDITTDVAHTRVAAVDLERVITRPMIDSEGNDAIRITLVLKPDAVRNITGDGVVDILVGIQQKLQDAGEERFPIVEYATEEELESEEPRDDEQADDDET